MPSRRSACTGAVVSAMVSAHHPPRERVALVIATLLTTIGCNAGSVGDINTYKHAILRLQAESYRAATGANGDGGNRGT